MPTMAMITKLISRKVKAICGLLVPPLKLKIVFNPGSEVIVSSGPSLSWQSAARHWILAQRPCPLRLRLWRPFLGFNQF